MQTHAKPEQSNGPGAACKGLAQQPLVTIKIAPCTGLLQRSLGKVVEFDFDERLARAITAVDTVNTPVQGLEQLRELLQARGQIWQVRIVGVFHAY